MTEQNGNQRLANYQHTLDMMGELGKAIPQTMGAFNRLHHAAVAEGALSFKVKELMALCIGITVRCDGCIMYHVNESMKAGATYEEIVETIGVAVMMGGGPSVMYGSEALAALDLLQEQS
jgi:AhpD family alkylhydroperoxidase